jgi:hypothetical protein
MASKIGLIPSFGPQCPSWPALLSQPMVNSEGSRRSLKQQVEFRSKVGPLESANLVVFTTLPRPAASGSIRTISQFHSLSGVASFKISQLPEYESRRQTPEVDSIPRSDSRND